MVYGEWSVWFMVSWSVCLWFMVGGLHDFWSFLFIFITYLWSNLDSFPSQ